MSTQDALWSATEVRTQAAQVRGQLTVWDCLAQTCTCLEPGNGRSVSPCPMHGEQT
jgi:hypothetical protein